MSRTRRAQARGRAPARAAIPAPAAILVPVLVGALAGAYAAGARALDFPGGTPGPVAFVSTRGTGGTEYVAAPSSRVVAKPAPRRPAPSKPPLKPAPRKPALPKPVRRPAPPKPKPAPRPKPKPAPRPAPPASAPPGVPTPAQTAAEGAVFPVSGSHSFGGPENRFGAGRAGHTHQGQDVLAGEGLPVLAPLAGTIVTTGYQAGGAGWYIAEQASDGLSFFFAHCQAGSVAVSAEASVRAGQQVCRVGQTGDATGPHLHFELWVDGWRTAAGYPIDPLSYLEAWDRG